MQSRASFDLDQSNNPVIKLEITSTSDVRDKIAKRFIESLGGASNWCEILPDGDGKFIIWPIRPEELRRQAGYMIAYANEIDKAMEDYPPLTESK